MLERTILRIQQLAIVRSAGEEDLDFAKTRLNFSANVNQKAQTTARLDAFATQGEEAL